MIEELEAIAPLGFKPGQRVAVLFRISDKRLRQGDVRAAAEIEKLKNQEELIMRIVADQKLILDPKHIYREARSAFKYGEDKRPVLQELMKAAEDKEFDILIVFKTDRLTRKGGRALTDLADRFNKLNINVFSCCQYWLDIRTSIGEMIWLIIGQTEKMESEGISVRMKRSRARRAGEGKFLGGGKVVELTENEKQEIFKLHGNGYSYDDIVKALRPKNPKITTWTVRKLLNDM